MSGACGGGDRVLGFPMGSTGEPDRKRRHFSSISPTATKQPFLPISEDKKVRSWHFFVSNFSINCVV